MSNPEDPKVTTTPHIIKEEVLAEGKWVKLEQTTYLDPAGNTRTWETAKRTTRRSNTEADGVGIIALLKRTLHKDCVVMVKQFRPPMGGSTLEFPAGLIDEGETAAVAALRELKEETGYKGEVVGVTPVTCLDPGLSNCTTQIALVNINGDDVENIHPTQQLGDGEFVEVILLPLDEFQCKIDDLIRREKIIVDSKVYIFAMGMAQAFFKPRELPVLKQ
ncbi:PREDICTED: ADP-sugar pyrophosphatase [Poecilia mexicana]|uniref:ADP-sugar pyrophosphatase n=1 Tax=Poecilia formosa TaxID=48698 RepID=A0A087Y5T3_POEFO|nr:PREDICTED: ADP-sugar pyrophosphatase [Poecilia formosa]XP_007571711.1 PREDICTED: ADP-sugar pyrophosphatase [Poecilia formosa]XP_007571712.1 PREDICTED: ADP-sugar pyrophosphatase [Poecilia formosa]XP_014832300.1 PREDICTED: ADP-sugar pyrophosphatase [Poecilia mexicana]XP_014832304.1 PREDICTED: ADP-sugar pyrophosphatase [Poecilia mexicana]XP_014832313.1 PREDICTED: ADP-sugar pyrophosphatase [Poecilia mexicana]XP_016536993.1 PREDICTED: ADP-sugar pyrophosphatase [Poecilia formosa]